MDFPLKIEVSDASKRAVDVIKSAGGEVICVHRTKLKLREHIKPEKFRWQLEEPLATYYTVRQYERIRERGAKVVYNEPKWVKEEREKLGDGFLKKPTLGMEVKNDGIKKRKPFIYRSISLRLKN